MRQRPIGTKTNRVAITGMVPRFYLGAIFAVAVYAKFTNPYGYVSATRTFLRASSEHASVYYAAFLATTVYPNIATYALVVLVAEMFVALSLLLGVLTRLGAGVAIILLMNYMLAKGTPIWSTSGGDFAFMVIALVVVMTGPGRVFGLDRYLAR